MDESTRTCDVDGCDRRHYARGWCAMHYARWLRGGDPGSSALRRSTDDPSERFNAKYATDANGCWIWQAFINPDGYGMFRFDGRMRLAHRFSYLHHVGPIPDGMELDHECRVRSCVNPDHLVPMSHPENNRRRDNGMRDVCKYGHKFTPENTYVHVTKAGKIWRQCRTCRRIRGKARRRA